MSRFSVAEALRFGWNTTRVRWGYYMGLSAVFILASVIFTPFQAFFSDMPVAAMVVAILSVAITLIVDLGFMKITLKTCDGEPTDFRDLFRYYDLSPRYFLGTVLYTLLILLSLIPGIVVLSLLAGNTGVEGIGIIKGVLVAILLSVPSAFLSIKFYFFGYFIVDQDAGAIEAFRLSARLTRGATWQILLLFVVAFAIILAGILALLVGLLIAYPIAKLTTAYAYRKLLETQIDNA
jgi:ABC-type multidrug transport system fused ATPase/permease subunit